MTERRVSALELQTRTGAGKKFPEELDDLNA
jgi:hypothetical protein